MMLRARRRGMVRPMAAAALVLAGAAALHACASDASAPSALGDGSVDAGAGLAGGGGVDAAVGAVADDGRRGAARERREAEVDDEGATRAGRGHGGRLQRGIGPSGGGV